MSSIILDVDKNLSDYLLFNTNIAEMYWYLTYV